MARFTALVVLTTLGCLASPALAAEEVNAASQLTGARTLGESGSVDAQYWALIDGSAANEWEPPFSENAPVVIELPESFELSRLVLINSKQEKEWPGLSVKRFRIEAAKAAKGPWTKLVEAELAKGTRPQGFKSEAKGVRYLRFSALSNYGSEDYVAVGELQAWGTRSKARQIDFTGIWNTSYGEMVLTQKGDRITGCYGPDEGKAGDSIVEGTLEGAVFAGTWFEKAAAEGDDRRGTMVFALTADGGLSGVWGEGDERRETRWDGTPKKKATITCEMPEASLGDELARKGRVTLRGILFDTGKDVIKPESLPVLEALVKAMNTSGKTSYLVEGHTDDRGGEAFNQKLSEKRAESVRKWLLEHGIEAKRLDAKGFGTSRPVMANDSEAGRAANRRVEVAVK